MDDAAGHGWRGRTAGAVVPTAGVLVGLATLWIVPRADLRFTTHAGVSREALVADSLAIVGLVVATLAAWIVRPDDRTLRGVVGLLAITWAAPNWIGWDDAPAVARTLGLLLAPMFVPAFAHLVSLRLGGYVPRSVLVAMYLLAAGLVVGRLAVYDPLLDLSCWSMCSGNVLLVSARPEVAEGLSATWTVVTALVGLATTLACARSLAGLRGIGRRTLLPVAAPATVIGLALVVQSSRMLVGANVQALDPVGTTTYLVLAAGTLGLAVGVTAACRRTQRARLAMATLATDLDEVWASRSPAEILARATGDDTLRIVYPLDDEGIHIDADGHPAGPATAPSRAIGDLDRARRSRDRRHHPRRHGR